MRPIPAPGEAGAGTGATGPHDVGFLGRGNGWVTIGLGADPAKRALLGSAGAGFGRLARFQPNGNISFEDDLAGYEAANNPDGFVPDSNPYGLAVLASRRLVADAGGNALNEVSADGTISTLAVFPNRFVQNPFAAPGVTIPMQAVPTTVAMGPDGALYVGQLTGFPFPVGGANVYRVAPDGTRTSIVSKESMSPILPGGVAVGSDGSLYVTRFSTAPGAGDVVRIRP
jgi:sugar lactone lactonase YvrE